MFSRIKKQIRQGFETSIAGAVFGVIGGSMLPSFLAKHAVSVQHNWNYNYILDPYAGFKWGCNYNVNFDYSAEAYVPWRGNWEMMFLGTVAVGWGLGLLSGLLVPVPVPPVFDELETRDEFNDPCSLERMQDPVIFVATATSRSFDSETADRILSLEDRKQRLCPLTREEVESYIPNTNLKLAINRFEKNKGFPLFENPSKTLLLSEQLANQLDLATVTTNALQQRLDKVGYRGEIPKEFLDPICGDIMENPVVFIEENYKTGVSFEQKSADLIITSKKNNCKELYPVKSYILNRDLKSAMERWVKHIEQSCRKESGLKNCGLFAQHLKENKEEATELLWHRNRMLG